MRNRKYFGTDGIRGRVGDAPITPDFVLKLGWAAGKVLARHGSRKIIIGKDTRISGYMLESALEAGLAAAGLSALFTGPMPTPAVAYLTRTFRAEAGIVISASHNPFYDNGIKFFSIDGTKLPDAVEEAIEAEMEKEISCVDSAELGKASRIVDAAGRYIEFCKATFPNELSLSELKIVVDCANGATYHIAPNVLRELGANVIAIGCEPNGVNINAEVGATDVRALQARVLAEKADLGIAFDGDGDRVIMVDHEGNKVDGDQIMYIIAREGLRQGQLRGGAVGTLMSNMGLELALKQLGIPFARAKVGDRYVLEKMQEKGWRAVGEIVATLVTGILWCVDKFFFAPKRRERQAAAQAAAGDSLDKATLKKVAPKPGWLETGASVFPVLAIVLIVRSFIYEPFQIPSGSMMPTLLIGDFILVEKFAYGIKDPIYQKTLIETGHPKRGDIVVFKYPEDPKLDYIKRAVGLPGDKVTYDPVSKELTIQPGCSSGQACENALPVTYSNVEPSDFVQTFSRRNGGEATSGFFEVPKNETKENGIRLSERKETLGDVTHRILTVPIAQDQVGMYYQQPGQQLATWIVPPGQYFMMGDNRDNSADSRYWGFVPEANLVGRATAIWMSFDKQEGEWPTGVRLSRIGGIH